MRGRAFRMHKARSKYMSRVNQIYQKVGGYKIDGDKVVPCETVKEYRDYGETKILKSQGNFDHHSSITDKYKIRKEKLKEKIRSKIQMLEDLQEID